MLVPRDPPDARHPAAALGRIVLEAGFLSWLALAGPSSAATISGTVRDASTGDPLEGARVLVSTNVNSRLGGALADSYGRYRLELPDSGRFVLVAARLGYDRSDEVHLTLGADDSLRQDFALVPGAIRVQPVVVTASRRRERVQDAPASVSVIGRRAIEERPALTATDHLRATAGLDVAATGLNQASVVARGFGSAQSAALLPIVDYRYASLPSLRYALFHFLPTPSEDMEQIEVVRGPGAAVYGPNSDRGVVHVVTRSPFESPGVSASLAAGEREIARGALRVAKRWNDRWAFKMTGQFLRGREWPDRDSSEVAGRDAALALGADPATVLIGRRDHRNERAAGEGALEWRGEPGSSVTLSAGRHQSLHSVEFTALGAVQVSDWATSYVQCRGSRGGFFGQAFVNWNDAPDNYFLRTGAPVRDASRLYALQAQQSLEAGSRLRLTAGADAQWTDPRTNGSITGRNEAHDQVREWGSYGHASLSLGRGVEVLGALRVDRNDRLDRLVASPRAAITYGARSGHTLRLTYNRAFGTPAVDDLFADFVYDSLDGPFAARILGVPQGGFTFRRENGSPLMRSPYTSAADGGPGAYRPIEATAYWDAVVAELATQGYDLDSIPAPTAADVATLLRDVSREGRVVDPASMRDLPGLEPTITNSAEVGYRGLWFGRVRLSVDLYRTWVEHFIGHLTSITPIVVLDPETLAGYLIAHGMPPATAIEVATRATAVAVGTVTPEEARDPWDVIFAVRNFGTVAVWGSDVSIAAALTDSWTFSGTFSWVSDDFFERVDGLGDLALNAPARKGTATIAYDDRRRGVTGEIRYRATAGFPVRSGVYDDRVKGYRLVDLGAGIRLGSAPRTMLSVAVENLFDRRHREFVGAPALGRLSMIRLSTAF